MPVPTALSLVILASLPLAAQERPAVENPALVRLADLVLERYAVQHVDATNLYEIAAPLVGRTYFVQENGPGAHGVRSLQQLGRTIVLYDTKDQVARALEFLTRLDAPRAAGSEPQETIELRPRFVSLTTLQKALDDVIEVTTLKERGLLLLNGDAASQKAALALAERIDVPEKQVLLFCQLVEVGATAQAPALPKELVDHLQRLLPQSSFSQVGMAMLKTSTVSRSATSVQIETPGKRYRLNLEPVAFDAKTGALTVTNCSLEEDRGDSMLSLFKTDTVLGPGYTVLAATGASARLLVIRVLPQD